MTGESPAPRRATDRVDAPRIHCFVAEAGSTADQRDRGRRRAGLRRAEDERLVSASTSAR